MTVRYIAAFLILGALPQAPARTAAGPVLAIVVSQSQGLSNISLADLRRIYLGQMTRWPDGRRIVPVVLPPGSVEQRIFLKRALQMADIDYAQHWIGQIFRGRVAGPPHTAATSAAARLFVAGHPDAIAFVNAADADSSVRILTVNQREPAAPDYALTP
jgi:hypothetical protein